MEVSRPCAGSLALSYVVHGKLGELRLPQIIAPARSDELWQHTCFEAFLGTAAGAAYYELNLAPSTRWAAYRFDSYRSGMRVATEIGAPRIEVQSAPDRFTLHASLSLDGLSVLPRDGGWRLGLAAITEDMGGGKSYWALAHPPGKPDFHHLDCFALEFSRTAGIMKFGIDRLVADPALRAPLAGRRVALLAHPASVTADLTHSLDALAACGDVKLTAAFGPQHGLRGDKQDNMVESPDFIDPAHGIPVFSLYGEVRRPTAR